MPKAPKTSSAAPYLRKEGLTFLRTMVRTNNQDPEAARTWFQANKPTYEAELKQPMLAIIRRVTDAMVDFAPEHVRPAEKSFFRIYRDTRFSNDKRPYKDHIAAWWSHTALEKTSGAGFYFHVAPKEITIAAGAYMPEKEQLAAIRHWLVDNHAAFRALLNKPAVRKTFSEFEGTPLTRAPKGFPTEDPAQPGQPHPALDLIRCRQWGLAATLPVDTALDPKFADVLVRHFKLAAPIVAALNTPIAATLEESPKTRQASFFTLPGTPKVVKTR